MNDDECIDSVALSREIKACCDIPNPIEMDHIQECVEKYEHLREDAASMVSCIYECHAMELGVMSESGFNKSKLLHLVNGIAASEVKAVVLDAIDQCAERTQEQVSSQDQSQFQCSPFALLLNECIVREVYAKCPDEHWADNFCLEYFHLLKWLPVLRLVCGPPLFNSSDTKYYPPVQY
ncbi:uncharacterized protein LOC128740474 [Sabethes cyaneus]|uniref:uncharacterized protein LOC128740474 n=1 Tax=Sabethes cyaneus TaxID=53552 RepID=UPI00237DBAB8|nr:uncharacterized protein LOC128740474 [Sabethes cyaneus]